MFKRLFAKKPKIVSTSSDRIKTAVVHTAGSLTPVSKSPDEAMRDLFDAVQSQYVYPDSKTFVDLVPRGRMRALLREYMVQRKAEDFDIQAFVEEHFYEFRPPLALTYNPSDTTTAREHIRNLWPVLTRRNRKNRGSLIALPYEYVVPGGRFVEQFYWDSYFIMLGLAADDQWPLIHGMIRNYSHMLRKFGMIPTANRTYFLSRSQPPFFSQMVKLLAQHRGRTRTYAEFLPSLLSEYRFWMKGRRMVSEHPDYIAYARVVCTSNGEILNRYFDNKQTPRPESSREDLETASRAKSKSSNQVFLDLRAGAESGWDFSSRWFQREKDIQSVQTTDIIPVDLNCLLYQLEQTIAEAYTLIKQPLLAKRFRIAAERRAALIRKLCWNDRERFFTDYNFRKKRPTNRPTLAGVFPLYAKIATTEQAAAVAHKIEHEFLKKGGLVTTLADNGQQWDSPNGWAPLQWVTIQGLREYGYNSLADEIRDRWLASNEAVFARDRKMVEKYDVVANGNGGGGEYPLQDGFGWTNGVYAALKDEQVRQ